MSDSNREPELPDLKPCPFCGEVPVFWQHNDSSFVSCKKCPADIFGETREVAVALWNGRVTETSQLADMQGPKSILQEVMDEWARAQKHAAYNSAHEGYAVILEELDELWDHVKIRGENRDLEAMRKEAIQVAVTAIRFVHDVCDGERGRK